MKRSYIYSLLGGCLLMVSCQKEQPFSPDPISEEGQLVKSALAVSLTDESLVRTRSNTLLSDFDVMFTKKGDSQPMAKYKYSEMPDVVTLPAGTYTCTATYGELYPVAWEAPYMVGESSEFEVKPMEITSYIEPIVCKLENIMVTVTFDPTLTNRMGDDVFVDVKVGASEALRFTKAEVEAGKAGYFMYANENTMVAVFEGTVDGSKTSETKTLKNEVKKGYHYILNFHPHPGSDPNMGGDMEADLRVEASVQKIDINCDVPTIEDEILDDNERPREGDDEGDDPTPPTQELPTITADSPIDLDKVNPVDPETSKVVLHMNSSAEGGFTKFECVIVSDNLTPAELESVGLSDRLDLVNNTRFVDGKTEDVKEILEALGLPVSTGGKSSVDFDLTGFLPMIAIFGSAEHHFVITVGDANGEVTKTLKLKI